MRGNGKTVAKLNTGRYYGLGMGTVSVVTPLYGTAVLYGGAGLGLALTLAISRTREARLSRRDAPILVLDEPTKHLDIPAREVLEQALAAYPGTLLIVSHDRYFLDRIISRLLYLRDGTCTSSAGNYTDYQAHLAAQTAALQPAPGVKKTSPGPARLRPRPAKRRP